MPVNRRALNPNAPRDNGGTGFRSSFADMLGSGGDSNSFVTPRFLNAYDAINEQDRMARRDRPDDDKDERRDMNWMDRVARGMSDAADAIVGLSGFDANEVHGLDVLRPDNLGRFALNTLLSQPTSFLSGPAQVYEGVSGHNIQDADPETGKLGEDLDSGQKWAAGLSGVIDTVGATHGGSGSFLKSGFNAARTLSGHADDAARAMGKAADEWGLGKFAGEVAEEAVEEGAQSLLGFARNEQEVDWGEVGKAAGYGALGGAMMSGAAYGINAALGDPTTKTPDGSATADDQARGWDYFSEQRGRTSGRIDSDMRMELENDIKKQNDARATVNYTAVPGSYAIRPNEARIGIRSLRRMYAQSDDDKNALVLSTASSANPLTRETMDEWFANDTDAQLVAHLNEAVASGTRFDGALKRDPHTKDGALMAFDIAGFNDGDALQFNPMVPQEYGADLDGDQWRLHFDDAETRGSLTFMEYLMSPRALPTKKAVRTTQKTSGGAEVSVEAPEGSRGRYGQSNFDYDYSGIKFEETYTERGEKRARLSEHANGAFQEAFGKHGLDESVQDEIMGIIRNAVSDVSHGADKSQAYGYALQRISDAMVTSYQNARLSRLTEEQRNDGKTAYDARVSGRRDAVEFVSDLIQNLQVWTHIDKDVEDITLAAARTAEEQSVIIEELNKTDYKFNATQGRPGSGDSILAKLEFLGKAYQAFSNKENAALRVDQNLQWRVGVISNIFQDQADFSPSAMEQLISMQLHIINVGDQPYEALSSTFKAYVTRALIQEGLISENGLTMTDEGSYRDFREKFCDVYNRYLRTFNKALEEAGWSEDRIPIGVSERQEISADDRMKPSFFRAFDDVLGSQRLGSLFRGADFYRNWSLSAIAEQESVAAGDGTMLAQLTDLSEDASEFVADYISTYNSRQAARGKGMDNVLKTWVEQLKDSAYGEIRFNDDGSVDMDPRDRLAYEQYLVGIRNVIGYKAAAYFGFMDIESTLASPYGRYLFSQSPDVVIRAVRAIGFAYKYREYIEARVKLRGLERQADEMRERGEAVPGDLTAEITKTAADCRVLILQNAGISQADRIICTEYDSTSGDGVGRDDLLRLLTDPSRLTNAELDERYHGIWNTVVGDGVMEESLTASALKNSESELGDGDLSIRAKRARTAFSAIRSKSLKKAQATAQNIEGLATRYNNPEVVGKAITQIAKARIQTMNLEIKAAQIADIAYELHDTSAKGTSPDSAALDYMQIARSNDSVEDFISRLTSQVAGIRSVDEALASKNLLISAIIDPDFSVTIQDSDGSYFELSQEAIFKDTLHMDLPDNGVLTFNHWTRLFSMWPQLTSFVAPTTFQPVPGGGTQVIEVMTDTLDKAVENHIRGLDGNNTLVVETEVEQTMSILSNMPAFETVIIGDVAARARKRYGTSDPLGISTNDNHAFAREVKGAYRRWARLIRNIVAGNQSEESLKLLKARLRNSYAGGLANWANSTMSTARSLAQAMANDYVVSDSAQRAYLQQEASDMVFISHLQEALGMEFDDVDSGAESPNVEPDVREEKIEQLASVMLMLSGETNWSFDESEYLNDQKIDRLRTQYLDGVDTETTTVEAARKQFDDAVIESARAALGLADMSDSEMSKYVILPADIKLDETGALRIIDKINNIVESGHYGIYRGDKEIPSKDMLLGLANKGDARELRKIAARWNSVVLKTHLNEVIRVSGRGVFSSFMNAQSEAIDAIETAIDEVRTKVKPTLDSRITEPMPDLDFTSPTATAFASHAQTVSESSGNAANSGIEGGTFRRLLSFGWLSESTFAGDDPESPMTTTGLRTTAGQLQNMLVMTNASISNREPGAPFVNPYDHCQADIIEVDANTGKPVVRRCRNLSYAVVSKMRPDQEIVVYPLDDSTHGIGRFTQYGVNRNRHGYVGINRLLSDLVFELSEGHVFKRKKALNVFKEVSRRVKENKGVKDFSLTVTGDMNLFRAQGWDQLKDYRQNLASAYWNEIKEEQLDGTIGRYDCLMLAQFTTPFVEVSLSDGTTANMSIEAFRNDIAWDEFVKTVGDRQILGAKPIVVPLPVIMERVNRIVGKRFNDYQLRENGRHPDRETMNAYVEEALSDWSDFRRKEGGVQTFLDRVAPLTMSSFTNMPVIGRMKGSMRFMQLEGDLPNMMLPKERDGREADVSIMSDDDYRIVERLRSSYYSGYENAVAITSAWVDNDFLTKIGSKTDRDMLSRFAALRNDRNTLTPSNEGTFRLVMSQRPEVLEREISDAIGSSYSLLVPDNQISAIRPILAKLHVNESVIAQGFPVILRSDSDAKPINLVQIDLSNKLIDTNKYDGPKTYQRIIDPKEIVVSVGTSALASSTDATSLWARDRAATKMNVEGIVRIPVDQMFPGISGGVRRPDRESFARDLADFKREFDKWVNGDETSRFVRPKYLKGSEMSDVEIENEVRLYLDRVSSDGDQSGLVSNGIGPGQCCWFVKMQTLSGDFYAPVMLNNSNVPIGGTLSLSSTDVLDADNITFFSYGQIAISEFDGIKTVFDVEAFKAYERVADEDQMDDWVKVDFYGKEVRNADRMYSLATEKSRLIDNRDAVLRNNLFWHTRLFDASLFHTNRNGKWEQGNSVLTVQPGSHLFEQLVAPNITDAHIAMAKGTLQITNDDRLNKILQVVAINCFNNDVPLSLVLSSVVVEPDGSFASMPLACEPSAVLRGLQPDELLYLYNTIDPNLCPRDFKSAADDSEGLYDINRYGEIRTIGPDGNTYYRAGHIEPVNYKLDTTLLGMPSYTGSFSNQQITNRALKQGFHESDMRYVSDMYALDAGDYTPWMAGGRYSKRTNKTNNPLQGYRPYEVPGVTEGDNLSLVQLSIQKMNEEGRNFYRKLVIHEDGSKRGEMGEPIPYSDNRVRAQLDRLRDAIGDQNASDSYLMMVFKGASGSTYNAGDGSRGITLYNLRTGVDRIVNRIERGEYPIQGGLVNGRISIPLLPRPVMDWMFESLRDKLGSDRKTFDDLAFKEYENTMRALTTVRPRSKRTSIMRALGYMARDNDIPFTLGEMTFGNVTAYDIAHAQNEFLNAISPVSQDPNMREVYDRRSREAERIQKNFERLAQDARYDFVPSDTSPSGYVAVYRGATHTGFNKAGTDAVAFSRALSMINLHLPPSAVVQRMVGSGTMKAMMFLDSRGIPALGGMMRNSFMFERDGEPQRILHQVCKDENLKQVWNAMNELQLTGSDVAAIRSAETPEQIIEIMNAARSSGDVVQRAAGKIFRMFTASGVATSGQIENFFNYAAAHLDPETSPWYFQRDQSGKTNFERMLESNPANLLVQLTTLNEPNGNVNPDVMVGLRARNFALDNDLAQQMAAGLILTEVMRRHSFLSFMLTTNLMKFPQYVFNVSGWYAKFVLPMSSINYWATDKLIKMGEQGKSILGVDLASLNLERTQVYGSLREAALADATRLTMTAIAGVIASLPYEPPEDERLWGNVNEWTFFGVRLEEVWWLQDIIGPAFAIAATWKSVALGRPRMDIIPNWLGKAMGNNPLIRAADVVAELFNQPEAALDGMVTDDYGYKGGEPSLVEQWSAGVLTYGMNWGSQFVLPSFVKELYQSSGDQYEHTYNRVYAVDAAGNRILDEDGQPVTVKTTYLDSRIRNLTRSNPMWAVLMNLFNPEAAGTGYLRSQMPRTVYYESRQLECMEYYSLYTTDPETGEEVLRPQEERRAIVYEILSELENSTPEELAREGFMIDYETREYVSKYLHDIRAWNQQLYNRWVQETGTDANVVGEGDFQLGMQRISRIKEAYWDDYNHIDELYGKLWDSALSGGPQKYNRYQTTYQQDDEGNWYATGFRRNGPFSPSPFQFAPGTLDDPASTMGWENNWETESAVTPGRSTGERALVPIDTVYREAPDIDSWSEDGDGGYSDVVLDSLGETADLTGLGFDTSDGDEDSRYPRYGRSYRRRGGGGGGGGGYSPNIYSRLPNLYAPSARTMYAERVYGPNYDYLRPNFETKGSREAYKRSDI